MSSFASYFDRVAVINLPSRPDRLRSVRCEVRELGFDEATLLVPPAPLPESDGGFSSRGVYGNYLSHLEILREALKSGCKRVLVLEDDAIFSRAARNPERQKEFIHQAENYDWAMWFLGHKLRREIKGEPKGVIRSSMAFHWAHAYAVQAESLPELIEFLEKILDHPAGHPEGGKMYIDAAYSYYREKGASKLCLVSNPALSIQKGSTSNLAPSGKQGGTKLKNYPINLARYVRDEFWRRFNVDFR